MKKEFVGGFVALGLGLVLAAPAAHAQDAAPDAQKRRNQIHLMEGLLARAGSIAAEAFAVKLHQIDPAMNWFIGQSRARGFVLEGYGVFFDVEVPELRSYIVLQQMTLQRDVEIGNALARLKGALESMPEGPSRQQAMQAVRVLDLQAGPLQPPPGAQPFGAAQDPAMRVNESVTTTEPVPAPEASDPPPQAALMAVIRDPRKEYRDTVQRELIDVMLDYSIPMDIAPDEWLAVAARVTEAGQRGNILMLRVKGSDLAIFAADKARRDEIRGKVEVRVF